MFTPTDEILPSYDLQARLLKVLTHPGRLAILDILRDGEHCVCHMEAFLGLRQAYISQQVAVLRQAGLIQDRRDGWNVFYHTANPAIYDILDSVRKTTGQLPPQFNAEEVNCSCPHCSGAVG